MEKMTIEQESDEGGRLGGSGKIRPHFANYFLLSPGRRKKTFASMYKTLSLF